MFQISHENTRVEISLNKFIYWKDTPTQVFSCKIREIFKNTYLKNICERLQFLEI